MRAGTGYGIIHARFSVWIRPFTDCLTGKMPKMKTKKCATKRMKRSATGKVLRSQGGKAHLNGYKSRTRKRNLRGTRVTDKSVQKTMLRMLQGA